MPNINVENKYPKGAQVAESLTPAALSGFTRGIAVVYGTDIFHCALPGATGVQCVGILDEDAIATTNPVKVIELGQCVAQIGAAVAALQSLTNNAAGQLIPAGPGQPVVAVALDANPNAGDYINVFACALVGGDAKGHSVAHYAAAAAIPVATGAYGIGSAAALAMTLVQPAAVQDGTQLFITAETAHAHTITTAANGINGTKHVCTFAAEGDGVTLVAMNQVWNVLSLVGTAALS